LHDDLCVRFVINIREDQERVFLMTIEKNEKTQITNYWSNPLNWLYQVVD